MAVPAWKPKWTKTPAGWVEDGNLLREAFAKFVNIQEEVPLLKQYAEVFTQFKQMPWCDIVNNIANGVDRSTEDLESSKNIMNVQELRTYFHEWKKACKSVRLLIEWNLFPHETASKILADFSRPGAYEHPSLYY